MPLRRTHSIALRLAAGAALLVGLGTASMAALFVRGLTLDLSPPPGGARVLSRPLVLTEGSDVERRAVVPHLEALGYRLVAGRPPGVREYRRGHGWLAIGPAGVPGARAAAAEEDTPARPVKLRLRGSRVRAIEDATGQRLESISLEPLELARLYDDRAPEERIPVRLDEAPELLVETVLLLEDRRFFDHPGLDLRRILAAAWVDLREGRIVQGGSTITQQLVKNRFVGRERTFGRKLREAAIALALEARYPKQQILEAYLNEVYLGQAGRVAIRGVGAASEHYFARPLSTLEPAELALLAALLRAPGRDDPYAHPEAARAERDRVLERLEAAGLLAPDVAARARAAPLGVRERRPTGRSLAPWLVARVRDELTARLGADVVTGRGLTVETSLDPALQHHAERAVAAGLARLERSNPRLRDAQAPLEAALVALDPRTGAVRAQVGGRDWARSQFDRATRARRQPGSAFKPLVAVAALEPGPDGEPVATLATPLEDAPFELATHDGVWAPTNHDGQFHGPVALRAAIEQSLNVPFARLGEQLGPARLVATARRLGIASPLAPVPSLALGASEVTLLELVRAYAVLAAGGRRSQPRWIERAVDPAGRVLASDPVRVARVVDPAVAYLVTSALESAVERGTGRSLRARGVRGAVAGKTGSTNDYRDAWFLGYTPELAVGVWVGFDAGRPVGLPGAAAALPIFADFLSAAAAPARPFVRPPGIVEVEVDRISGRLAGPGCPGEPELFLAGTAPTERCAPWAPDGLPAWRTARAAGAWLGRLLGGPSRPVERCRIRVRGLDAYARAPGRFEVALRVSGEAGDDAIAWLAARLPGGRYVSGRGVRVGRGRFRERVALRLDRAPERVLAVLEVGGERCADPVRLPRG